MGVSALPAVRAWFWKEWRENLPKMVGLLLAYAMLALAVWGEYERVQVGVWFLTLVSPGIVAVGVLSGERWQRTHAMQDALPIGRAEIFLVKWVCGLLSLVIPLSVVMLGAAALAHRSSMNLRYSLGLGRWMFEVLGTAVVLYAWSMAAGGRFVRSFAPVAMVVLVNVFLLLYDNAMHLSSWAVPKFPTTLFPWSIADAAHGASGRCVMVGWLQAGVVVVLTAAATWNWSRSRVVVRARAGVVGGARQRAVRSWNWPVGFKTWREMRWPFVCVAAITWGALPVWLWVGLEQSLVSKDVFFLPPEQTINFSLLLTVALAVGLGARFGATQAASPAAFWTTRPIRAGRYFWAHFWTELGALGLLAVGPVVLGWMIGQTWIGDLRSSPAMRRFLESSLEGVGSSALLFFVGLPLVYALATLWGTVTRSVILAVTFTIPTGALLLTAEAYVLTKLGVSSPDGAGTGWLVHIAITAMLTVGATGMARLFFEFDPFRRTPTMRVAG